MSILQYVLIAICIIHFSFQIYYGRNYKISPKYIFVGFISNVLDYFGVGSFTQQTLFLKREKHLKGKSYLIPGTLNVANYIPMGLQAIIILTVVEVQYLTLLLLTFGALIGAYIGSKFISLKNNTLIMYVLSSALIISSILLFMNALDIYPFNSTTTELNGLDNHPIKLIISFIIYTILGFLGSFGLGIYAPGFAVLGLMGVSYIAILPVNMISAIMVSTGGSFEFITKNKFDKKISFTITIFGGLGVLFAGYLYTTPFFTLNISTITKVLQILVALVAFSTGIKFYFDTKKGQV